MQTFLVCHVLICINVGLVITHHNKRCDKIIQLTMLIRLAPLAVTVGVKFLLLINEFTCNIFVTSGSIGGNRLCVCAPTRVRAHVRARALICAIINCNG